MDRSQSPQLIARLSACALVLLTAAAAASASAPQIGQWALRGATPQIIGKLSATASRGGTDLDIAQFTQDSHQLITNYTLDQTQYMHLIVVRADFREFMHLHPTLRAGHFRIPVALSAGQRYYAYADSRPSGLGQQVLRFTLKVGVPPPLQTTKVAASLPETAAGPYVVRLSKTIVPGGRPFSLDVTITRNGRFANDLQPYLAAAAHVVLISTADLSYTHVHPMPADQQVASDMTMPEMKPSTRVHPRMQLMIPLLHRGAYKMWLQFRGGGTLYVAPFTVVAR